MNLFLSFAILINCIAITNAQNDTVGHGKDIDALNKNLFAFKYYLSGNTYDYSRKNVNPNFIFNFEVGGAYIRMLKNETLLKTSVEFIHRKTKVKINEVLTRLYETFVQIPVLFVNRGKLINDDKSNRKFKIRKNVSVGGYYALSFEQGYAANNESRYNFQNNTKFGYGKFGYIVEYYFSFLPLKFHETGYLIGLRLTQDIKGSAHNIRSNNMNKFDKYTVLSLFGGVVY